MMANYSENILPVFTSASPVNGVSITATPFVSGYEGWRMLQASGDGWYPNLTSPGYDRGVIVIDLGKPRSIGKYSIRAGLYFPKTWTVQGSNTGAFSGEQEILDTVLDSGVRPTNIETVEYHIDTPKSYRYYKINITNSMTGTYLQISKIEMMEMLYISKFLISSGDGIITAINGWNPKDNLIPTMTSNISSEGEASCSSKFDATYDAWRAFDGVSAGNQNGWATPTNTTTGWLAFYFYKPQVVTSYSMISRNPVSSIYEMPKDWTFEGSNDDVTWVVLDTQENVSWTAGVLKSFVINNTKGFNRYRINITANGGTFTQNYLCIGEVKMTGYEELKIQTIPKISEDYYLKYGIEKNSVINPSIELSKRSYISDESTSLGSGKVFKKKIDTSEIPIKQASIS